MENLKNIQPSDSKFNTNEILLLRDFYIMWKGKYLLKQIQDQKNWIQVPN